MVRKMKDSGVEWIGEIPEDWRIKPINNCFKERNEKVSDYDWEPLSVTKQGILKQLDNAAKSDAHDARKKVCKGDFVINSRSDRKQSCGISNFDGSVSLINIVLENQSLCVGYVKYLLKNYGFAEEFYRWGTGIVADLWSTNFQRMKKIMIPIPSNIEQQKIANFLDKKVDEIDSIIEKTKESIEEYKKYKQAVITEAVTKGLNKSVSMKDSGVEWIGQIPECWNIVALKKLFTFGKGLSITKADLIDKGAPVISYGQIHSKMNKVVSVDETLIRFVSEEYLYNSPQALVEKNDFIFADTSEDLSGSGNCIYINENRKIFAGYHTIIARPNKNEDYKYLAYLFLTDCWRSQIRSRVTGIKLFSISQKILREVSVLLPREEIRKEIVDYLDKKIPEIDALISKKEAFAAEMESYKKALIYEYVTGKKEAKD